MRKWGIVGGLLLLLIVVAIVAVLNLNSLVKRNKDYLLGQVEQALGRKVSVEDVELTVWSGIGLRLNRFAMSDDPKYSSGDFVRAAGLQVNVKLMPLLRKEFQVKRVILHDPKIALIRDRGGEFNFSTIGKREKTPEAKPEREPKAPPEKKTAPLLLVSLVDISGGELHYVDRKEGIDLRAKQIDLQVKDLDFNKPFSVSFAAALFADRQNVKIQSRVGPVNGVSDFSLVPLDGEIQIDEIDFDKLKAALPQLKTALPKDLNLSGIVKVKEMQVKGALKKLALKGSVEGTDAGIQFAKSFAKPAGIPLVLSADAEYSGEQLSLRQVKLKLHSLDLAGKGRLSLGNRKSLDLALDSNRFSFDGWEKLVPMMRDYQLAGDLEIHTKLQGAVGGGATPRIEGTLNLAGVSVRPPQFPKAIKDLNTRIEFTGQRANLRETTLSLGNSKIRLTADIERFSPLTLSYKMSTPEIWPADFQSGLPEERKADVIRNLTSEGKLDNRNGNMAFLGRIASAHGTLYNVGYKDLAANLSLQDKVANIRDMRVAALKGSLRAEGEYAFNNPVPRFALATKAQNVDLKDLYQALDPKAERDIRGTLNADAKLVGSGANWEEIKPRLRGDGDAEVVQGALLNFNIAEGTLSGVTGIPGLTSLINPRIRQKYPETFEAKDTEFKELKGQFNIADGRMNITSLRITAADYAVQGKGWADFNRKLDFRSVLVFSQRLSADIAGSAREVKYMFNDQGQFEIPFALSGTLPKVRPKPDSDYLARLVQRGFLRKGTEELQRRFFGRKESTTPQQQQAPSTTEKRDKGSTEDLIRRGLEGLFGR